MSEISYEKQKCFIGDDGYVRCNYIFRNGKIIRTRSGKWMRFFPYVLLLDKQKMPKEFIQSLGTFENPS